MEAFIENPAGQTLKQEFDEKTNTWDKKGNLAVPYPFPYGFIKRTLQEDGDPLDVFLITKKESNAGSGAVFEIELLGLIEYFESNERDYKILAKITGEDIALDEEVKKKLKYFLIHAFDNIPGKKVEFKGFFGKENALTEINKCQI